MQYLYENRCGEGEYLGPMELVEGICEIIEKFDMKDPLFVQEPMSLFKKASVPKKQVMALYAINKICSIANGEKL